MRQIGVAMAMYSNDYHGCIVPMYMWDNVTYRVYDYILLPYLGVTPYVKYEEGNTVPMLKSRYSECKVFACPADPFNAASNIKVTKYPRSYAMVRTRMDPGTSTMPVNGGTAWAWDTTGTSTKNFTLPIRYTMVPRSSNVLLLVENPRYDNPPGSSTDGWCDAPALQASGSLKPGLTTHPRNSWNYLFVDGHVENLLPIQTLGPNGSIAITAPNNGYLPGGMWTRQDGD